DVRWLSKLQFLSILCSSKDAIAAFIARRNMARGDKIVGEQVDDIEDLELQQTGEPTAGYDADEVQKTIDEMEAERKAHNKAKAKKDRRKPRRVLATERERFAKRSGLCLFVTAPWSYKEARIYDDLGSDDLLAQTDKKRRTFYLLGYENRFKALADGGRADILGMDFCISEGSWEKDKGIS
ncbi:hypothetical protein FOZ61_010749, partial [Perkinsus olseni]